MKQSNGGRRAKSIEEVLRHLACAAMQRGKLAEYNLVRSSMCLYEADKG